MQTQPPSFLDGPHGRIAYRQRAGDEKDDKPGVIWLGGFRSDMLGTKAEYLGAWAAKNGRGFLRFDYSGHGESDGRFEDGCIGDWAADAHCAIEALTDGPQILIGSSMGAWIATLIAKAMPERLSGIIFIAPAPDFTEKLMWPSFSDGQREAILRDGRFEQPSDYSDEPEVFTRKLFEDGARQSVMDGNIAINCPVRVLQGMKDDAVPWAHAAEFASQLASDDVEITLTPNGDHRLSEPADLARLAATLDRL